jgi:hypothetical protein
LGATSVCNLHKTAQSKRSHIGPKFAQSGHPAHGTSVLLRGCERASRLKYERNKCQKNKQVSKLPFSGLRRRKRLFARHTKEGEQGCQMVHFFVPKIPIWVYFGGPWNVNVGIFYGHFVYLRTFGKFHRHFVYFVIIWSIFSCLGILYREKSGNHEREPPQKETGHFNFFSLKTENRSCQMRKSRGDQIGVLFYFEHFFSENYISSPLTNVGKLLRKNAII